MCGIVGYIAIHNKTETKFRKNFLRQALIFDEVRGRDSSGLITVKKEFKGHMVTSVLPGHEFVTSDAYKEHNEGWAAIGHNRAATRGSVKLANAHPFKFGDVVMVHNGTLVGGGKNLPGYDAKLEVDSMNIAKSLSEVGPDEAEKVLSEIDGSFALAWIDNRDASINITRNGSRPFHMAWNKTDNLVVFMSDGMMLKTLLKYFSRDFSYNNIMSLQPHKLLKFKKGSVRPEVRTYAPFVPPTPIYSNGSNRVSAEDVARRRWGPSNDGGHGTSRSHLPTMARAIRDLKTTAKHLLQLRTNFQLSPKDYLRFDSVRVWPLPKGAFVQGTILHPGWDNIEWDAEVFIDDVKEMKRNLHRSWVVRPVGVGRPVFLPSQDGKDPSNGCPSIRCHFERFDYVQMMRQQESHIENEKEPNKMQLVKGVGGRMTMYGTLLTRLQDGCAGCSANLVYEDAEHYADTNDGQDILCEDCKWTYGNGHH